MPRAAAGFVATGVATMAAAAAISVTAADLCQAAAAAAAFDIH